MKFTGISFGILLAAGASAQTYIAVGSGAGRSGEVNVYTNYDLTTGSRDSGVSFMPYGPGFTTGVKVALGDIDGDGAPEIITSTGAGGGPHIKAFDLAGNEKLSFFAYDQGFVGGVSVAAGDVNGDGLADIITATGAGGGPHVKVFSGANSTLLHSFFSYSPNFTGGVRVASGDVNGDGRADIITGSGPGAGPHIKAFSGTDLTELTSLFAFDAGLMTGINVAAGDVNGDGFDDLLVSPGAGGGPHVKAFNGRNGAEMSSFFAFDQSFSEGMYVAAGDLDGDGIDEILAGGEASATGYKIFDRTGTFRNTFAAGAGSTIAVFNSPVPEPGSMLAITAGLVAFGVRRKRKA